MTAMNPSPAPLRNLFVRCPDGQTLCLNDVDVASVVVRALLLLLLISSSIPVYDRHINMSIAINLNRHEPLSSEIDVRGTQK